MLIDYFSEKKRCLSKFWSSSNQSWIRAVLDMPHICPIQTSWGRLVMVLLLVFYLFCSSMRSERTVTVSKKGFTRNSAIIRMLENSDSLTSAVNTTDIDETEEVSPVLPRVTWNAAVKSSVRVKEGRRTCEEYMRLPASECKMLMASCWWSFQY